MLFVDVDPAPDRRRPRANARSAFRLHGLLTSLGPYTELVTVVVTSPWTAGRSLMDLRALLAPQRPETIAGTLWDDPPPRVLSRYDHIVYWLTRRHVMRLPTWLALQTDVADWPDERSDRLIHCVEPLDSLATQRALRSRLERYYWADLWWGGEPGPDSPSRWRAHALMVAWSIPRRQWPEILGQTAAEFEQRLDLLLTVHAGAQHHVRAGTWFPHWVHLTRRALGMQRPIELIATNGVAGIQRVLDLVWSPAHSD